MNAFELYMLCDFAKEGQENFVKVGQEYNTIPDYCPTKLSINELINQQ